jgi:hypothetical protein
MAASRQGSGRCRRGQERGRALLGAALLAGVVALSSCSSGTHPSSAPATTVAVDSHCPLTRADAVKVLGSKAAADRPPVATGVERPIDRCEYAADGASLQLTIFTGRTVLDQIRQVLTKATPAAELGPDAYCNAGPGTNLTAMTCIFLKDADTYVLGLLIPNSRGGATARQQVRDVADRLARAPSVTTTTSP